MAEAAKADAALAAMNGTHEPEPEAITAAGVVTISGVPVVGDDAREERSRAARECPIGRDLASAERQIWRAATHAPLRLTLSLRESRRCRSGVSPARADSGLAF